jgi:hypothetical protein
VKNAKTNVACCLGNVFSAHAVSEVITPLNTKKLLALKVAYPSCVRRLNTHLQEQSRFAAIRNLTSEMGIEKGEV